jgi:alkylation response protein AidB-like acyl-CoA dehydrogenase
MSTVAPHVLPDPREPAALERPASEPLAQILPRVRQFAREELLPQQAHLDSFPEVPLPLNRSFHELGVSGWWLPQRYGGMGLGLEESVDIVSELAYGDAGVAFTSFISILGTTMVSLYGSEELKERHLTPLARDGRFCATLASERAAGSELTKIATIAAREGDDVVLNGEKFFSTNAGFASFLVVIARSTGNPPEHIAMLVPADAPGVRIAAAPPRRASCRAPVCGCWRSA